MASLSSLSPRARKAMVYGGLGLAGATAIYVSTLQTERAPAIREPEAVSLTGNIDTRSVSLEGMSRRLEDLEQGRAQAVRDQDGELRNLRGQVGELTRLLETMRVQDDARTERMIEDAIRQQITASPTAEPGEGASPPTDPPVASPVPVSPAAVQDERNRITDGMDPRAAQARIAAEEERLRRERDAAEQRRRESIYLQPAPLVQQQATQQATMPAPRIAVFQSPDPEPAEAAAAVENASEPHSKVPDLQIPAGSVITAMMMTGLDAPTGARAQSQPVPVLLRIKADAMMPNLAWADVKECHLLGSAYGDLASERVNIRGETVSCILADNSAVEGAVKFFVTGEDGKNGIRGTLVSRSGRVLASAAGAALTQGLLSSFQDQSAESIFLGGGAGGSGGGEGGAIGGASKGFDLLTEYYLDLAEQTFPVIEIPNGRWVDVVLTEMLTVKFKG